MLFPANPKSCVATHSINSSEMSRGTTSGSSLYSLKEVQAGLDKSGVHRVGCFYLIIPMTSRPVLESESPG